MKDQITFHRERNCQIARETSGPGSRARCRLYWYCLWHKGHHLSIHTRGLPQVQHFNNNNSDKLSWHSSIPIKAELLTNLTRHGMKSNRKYSRCWVQRTAIPMPSALPEQVQRSHRPCPVIRRACKQVQSGSTAQPHTAEELPSTAWWKLAGVAYAGIIFSAYIIYYRGCFPNLILNLVGDFQHNWRADTLFPLLYWSCFSSVGFQSSYWVVNELSIICANWEAGSEKWLH